MPPYSLCLPAVTRSPLQAFAFLLPRAGLLVALVVLIVGSALASKKTRFERNSVLIASGLVVFCVLVFVKGLGLPLQLFGSWFGG